MQRTVLPLVVGALDQQGALVTAHRDGAGTVRDRLPLGPLTVTNAPSMVASTVPGTAMGVYQCET